MVDTLADFMTAKGVGSLLFKCYLQWYCHQIFVDPADIPKLEYYLDDILFFARKWPSKPNFQNGNWCSKRWHLCTVLWK